MCGSLANLAELRCEGYFMSVLFILFYFRVIVWPESYERSEFLMRSNFRKVLSERSELNQRKMRSLFQLV